MPVILCLKCLDLFPYVRRILYFLNDGFFSTGVCIDDFKKDLTEEGSFHLPYMVPEFPC